MSEVDAEVEEKWQELWADIIVTPAGNINLEQVKRELYDYARLIENMSEILCGITGSRVSKPNTDPGAVLALYEEQLQQSYEDGYRDAGEEICG